MKEVNAQLPAAERLPISLDTEILGASGKLDSLGIVNLVTAIEEKLAAEGRANLNLLEDADFFDVMQRLTTAGSLATFLEAKLAR